MYLGKRAVTVTDAGSVLPNHVAMKYVSNHRKREQEKKVMHYMKQHPHPNVVQFYCTQGDYFVMEHAHFVQAWLQTGITSCLLHCGSLTRAWSYKDASAKFENWFSQIIAGIDHFHQHDYFHGDIKENNIMFFDKEFTKLKLVDFGQAQTKSETGMDFDWYRLVNDVVPSLKVLYGLYRSHSHHHDKLLEETGNQVQKVNRPDVPTLQDSFAQWFVNRPDVPTLIATRFPNLHAVFVDLEFSELVPIASDCEPTIEYQSQAIVYDSKSIMDIFFNELSAVRQILKVPDRVLKLMHIARNFYLRTYLFSGEQKFNTRDGSGNAFIDFAINSRGSFSDGLTMIMIFKKVVSSLKVANIAGVHIVACDEHAKFGDISFVRDLRWRHGAV